MFTLHTANTSNGHRAAIMLEECGLRYDVRLVDLMAGAQRQPEFLKLNPAGAVPVLVDDDGPGGKKVVLPQSAAILLYLAEKTGRYLPTDPARRASAYQWLMFACTDVSPASMNIFFNTTQLPDRTPANLTFFEERVLRYLRVADAQLANHEYLGDELSIADFALFAVLRVRKPLIERAGNLTGVSRWMDMLAARPAVQKGLAVTP